MRQNIKKTQHKNESLLGEVKRPLKSNSPCSSTDASNDCYQIDTKLDKNLKSTFDEIGIKKIKTS